MWVAISQPASFTDTFGLGRGEAPSLEGAYDCPASLFMGLKNLNAAKCGETPPSCLSGENCTHSCVD